MNACDTITIGNRTGQVECFADKKKGMRTLSVGSYVGPMWVGDEELTDYSVALREGGFVNITGGVVQSWRDRPEHEIVVDKWGSLFDAKEESPDAGLLWGEKYFFGDMKEGEEHADKGQG